MQELDKLHNRDRLFGPAFHSVATFENSAPHGLESQHQGSEMQHLYVSVRHAGVYLDES